MVPIDPTEPPSTGIHKIIDLSKYSTLTKLLCVTGLGYVLKFITNLRNSSLRQTGPCTECKRTEYNLVQMDPQLSTVTISQRNSTFKV